MGLDVSHDAWHGSYSAFGLWRNAVAKAIGVPLGLMDGYWGSGPYSPASLDPALAWLAPGWDIGQRVADYRGPVVHSVLTGILRWLPISWDILRHEPLVWLLDHSDCDGTIGPVHAGRIARRLRLILPELRAIDHEVNLLRIEQAKRLIALDARAPVFLTKGWGDGIPIRGMSLGRVAAGIKRYGYRNARPEERPGVPDSEASTDLGEWPPWSHSGHVHSHAAAALRFARGCERAAAAKEPLRFA